MIPHQWRILLLIALVSATSFVIMFRLSQRLR
jgi:hypothetical protein